jgi:hypothetical protein
MGSTARARVAGIDDHRDVRGLRVQAAEQEVEVVVQQLRATVRGPTVVQEGRLVELVALVGGAVEVGGLRAVAGEVVHHRVARLRALQVLGPGRVEVRAGRGGVDQHADVLGREPVRRLQNVLHSANVVRRTLQVDGLAPDRGLVIADPDQHGDLPLPRRADQGLARQARALGRLAVSEGRKQRKQGDHGALQEAERVLFYPRPG